jgi:hypothetical protein
MNTPCDSLEIGSVQMLDKTKKNPYLFIYGLFNEVVTNS